MDRKDFLTYRIMKGRLSFCGDGFSIYIKEPDPDLLYDSIFVHEETYNKAYGEGVYLRDEILQLLYEKDLYSPFDDVDIERYKKDIEELKFQAFKNAFKPKELSEIKKLIRFTENTILKISKKKLIFDHLTCEGTASLAQWNWIIENSTYYADTDRLYDWKHVSVNTITSYHENQSISSLEFRQIARSDLWRPIWFLGKKTGNLFDRPSSKLTKDQIILCSFSNMYDNVYESSESPVEKIIDDDDCLDGWFVDQKRKNEKAKKQQEAEALTSNKRIANAGEVFVVASTQEEIENIESYNSVQMQNVKKNRVQQIFAEGEIKSDLQFQDRRLETQLQNNQAIVDKAKGR
jgi:hypothetical protein